MAEITMKLKPQEAALIDTMREMENGCFTIKVRDGLPFRGEEPIKYYDFTDIAKEKGYLKSNKLEKAV